MPGTVTSVCAGQERNEGANSLTHELPDLCSLRLKYARQAGHGACPSLGMSVEEYDLSFREDSVEEIAKLYGPTPKLDSPGIRSRLRMSGADDERAASQ